MVSGWGVEHLVVDFDSTYIHKYILNNCIYFCVRYFYFFDVLAITFTYPTTDRQGQTDVVLSAAG